MEPPLLKRLRVELDIDEPITHMTAGHNRVCIATKDKKIVVIDTRTNKQTHCDIARCLGNRLSQAKVHKIFMDPTGKFILISLVYASDNRFLENLLYAKQLQPLPRLKDHVISAVAWNYPRSNPSSNLSTSGTVLLGTTKGLVLQTEFVCSDETKFFPLSTGSKQYVKEIFDVGTDFSTITGIEYHQIHNGTQTERSYVILLCTNNRLYRMVGNVPVNVEPPPFSLIFTQNSNNYKDVPGKISNSKLDLYYPQTPNCGPPTRFAWLTEPGIMTSDLYDSYSACKSSFETKDDINIIPYSDSDDIAETPLSTSAASALSSIIYQDRPVSIVVTGFHVIVLFRQKIRAICILNTTKVYEEYLTSAYGTVQGMTKDPIKNIIWVYCKRAVFRYKFYNENKNVWKIFLEQKRFDLARKYSSGDEINYDRVICEEAQHYFKLREYEKSAEIFARSKKSFEDVSLMFMEVNSNKALKKYLMIRLDELESTQKTEITMTLAWLFEIMISSYSVHSSLQESDDQIDEFLDLEQLFENKQIVDCLRTNSKLFYGITSSYSNKEFLIKIAQLVNDHETIIHCHLDSGQFEDALEVVKTVNKVELFYKYGHILMKRKPKELVDALIEQPRIDPSKLIPILIQENPYFNKCSETIRYLEFCVNTLETDSKVLRNYLFQLYARHRDETTLINYLESECKMDGIQENYLNLQFCLHLCNELKLTKTSVVLYSLMNLFDDAVKLALKFDIELAKSIARKAETDEHQKRLWVQIAENILTKNADIEIATSLLSECRLLKIEDILPFFPDYTTIDYFRDPIRSTLQEYRNQIMSLKDGTYDNIADEIKSEIKGFKSRYSIIKYGQNCEICSRSVMARTFYVFPCGHLFHSDCIIREMIKIDPHYKEIENKLKLLSLDSSNAKISKVTELDQIVSSECIYCGSLLASYIDKPAPIESSQRND